MWRDAFEKVVDQFAAVTDDEIDDAIVQTTHGKHLTVKQYGRSAYQAAFGRAPRVPGELGGDPHSLIVASNMEDDGHWEDARTLSSRRAIMDWNINDEIRRSILKKVQAAGADDFRVGLKVAYWREHVVRGRKRKGYVLYIFAGYDGGLRGRGENNNAWVVSGGRHIQVSRRQLRRAVGFETWTPSKEDINALRRAER